MTKYTLNAFGQHAAACSTIEYVCGAAGLANSVAPASGVVRCTNLWAHASTSALTLLSYGLH